MKDLAISGSEAKKIQKQEYVLSPSQSKPPCHDASNMNFSLVAQSSSDGKVNVTMPAQKAIDHLSDSDKEATLKYSTE